ncbi:hypothetical protein [Xanthomarina sp.]|uniref:hypothetical protein n=1 Tax=Xanthomarina sp. TaxID=1931211 RepID=UPI002D05559F|nr:hypothetical protein [Xanthomarina sp.]HLV40559.1 hypothetical protein [Xanthomarina sp.]
MKTYVLGLLFFGLTNLMIAQSDLAVLTPSNQNMYASSKTVLNAEYLNTFTTQDFSIKIEKLQNLVANYNIKMADVYQAKNNGSYTVDFKEGDNIITAVYNKNGVLLSCDENYQAIKLPYAVSSKLIKEYPHWAIKEVKCNIKYIKDNERSIVYHVAINNGGKTKKITIKV